MNVRKLAITIITASILVAGEGIAVKSATAVKTAPKTVLWHNPAAGPRNLLYGMGSKERQPHGPFTFIKEDTGGSNPKYTVRDVNGVKWKIKLGQESRAETAASRFIWAAGYYTKEVYLVPTIQVEELPAQLKRHSLIEHAGIMRSARFEREVEGQKKVGVWKWRDNPFTGSREFNGLRVMMALVNNWDVKDENNSIYQAGGENIYMVSDIGATFGATHRTWPAVWSKDNYQAYRTSGFLCHDGGELISFCTPGRPSIPDAVAPIEFFGRLKLRWIGRDIPRADAKWIGSILDRLSPQQIRDAFRAGGFSPSEIDGFSDVVEARIRELTSL